MLVSYACLACEFVADTQLLKLQRLQNQGHTDPRVAHGFTRTAYL
jgi:hypothetical protein